MFGTGAATTGPLTDGFAKAIAEGREVDPFFVGRVRVNDCGWLSRSGNGVLAATYKRRRRL